MQSGFLNGKGLLGSLWEWTGLFQLKNTLQEGQPVCSLQFDGTVK